MQAPSLRPATQDDLAVINSIYNYYVLTSTATYQTARKRRRRGSPGSGNGILPGIPSWSWNSRTRSWPGEAYPLLENGKPLPGRWRIRSTFTRSSRDGAGKLLLQDQILEATRQATIPSSPPFPASSRAVWPCTLHGFTETGRLREVGWKFGQWLDLVYLQRML